jgi:hypothetical protein
VAGAVERRRAGVDHAVAVQRGWQLVGRGRVRGGVGRDQRGDGAGRVDRLIPEPAVGAEQRTRRDRAAGRHGRDLGRGLVRGQRGGDRSAGPAGSPGFVACGGGRVAVRYQQEGDQHQHDRRGRAGAVPDPSWPGPSARRPGLIIGLVLLIGTGLIPARWSRPGLLRMCPGGGGGVDRLGGPVAEIGGEQDGDHGRDVRAD